MEQTASASNLEVDHTNNERNYAGFEKHLILQDEADEAEGAENSRHSQAYTATTAMTFDSTLTSGSTMSSMSNMSNMTAETVSPISNVTPRTMFACLSMHMTDRIRLSRFPESHVPQIVQSVEKGWPKGVKDTRAYDAATEIKLHGNPWRPSRGEERANSRRLLCRTLSNLYEMGWIISASVDVGHVDSLMFRYQQPSPPPCIWMSITFAQPDRIEIIDAPNDFGLALADALGPKVVSCRVKGSIFEIKMQGQPWRAAGTDTVQTRFTLLTVMDSLDQQGFALYAPINQNNVRWKEGDAEPDTWYCNRQADWKPGAPVYHR